MFAPGKACQGSFAATEMAPSALAGEPVTYGLGPLLPAEATTMTPALAALVDATADGSSFERIRIRVRNRLVSQRVPRVGVIAVADEVEAALDARRRRAEQRGIGLLRLLRVGRCVRRGRTRAAEVGVGVVDSGVDDRDLHAL